MALSRFIILGVMSSLSCMPAMAMSRSEEIARHHCLRCHEIAPGVRSSNPVMAAPSFMAMGNDPEKYPEIEMLVAMRRSHHAREPFIFTESEKQDMIDYIQGFAAKK